MKRNSLFTKAIALLVCAIMLIGYLPSIALPVAAANDEFESDIDVVETTTEEPTEPPLGSEANPIFLTAMENSVENEGTIYYQGRFNGMIMTVTGADAVIYNGETYTPEDGAVELAVSSPYPRMPVVFAVVGDGTVEINFSYPLGTVENPAIAVLGDNVIVFEDAPTAEYVWNYVAENDGKLNITISANTGWQYVVNNLTTYAYGDTQWSDSDPVVNPTTITVAADDVIEIKVITYDPANMWAAPAGAITVNLAYACDHADTTTNTTPATCTEAGVETVVCNACGETISSTEVPALGHDHSGEMGACVRCGQYQIDETLEFYYKGVSLGADIRGGLQVRKMKATSPYQSFKVIAERGGVKTELELVNTSDKSKHTTYTYALTLAAKELADIVDLRIVGITADGVAFTSKSITWSIKEGLIALMDEYAGKNEDRVKLGANVLHYGAMAQEYFGYATDNLATDGLKEEYAALIIRTTPEVSSIPKAEEPSGTYATLTEVGFNLAARVQIMVRFKVPKADKKESYSAEFTKVHIAPDGTETTTNFTLSGDKIMKSATSTSLYVLMDNLSSNELRDVMQITLLKDGKPVSVVHTFSGESALYPKMSNFPDLSAALMNYGDCARVVFG